MATERVLLLFYGSVLIAACFMILSLGRLAVNEAMRVRAAAIERHGHWRGRGLRRNVYFVITSCLVLQSLALLGVGGLRVGAALAGERIGGAWPLSLAVCMGMLFSAMAGFHWAGMVGRQRRVLWRAFVGFELIWIVYVFVPPLVL